MNLLPVERCAKCDGVIDPKGATDRYCSCVCRWPAGGCGARIFFRVNPNEKLQPFDLDGEGPHHATCRAYLMQRDAANTCPACGGKRRRDHSCTHCGWSPDGRPASFTVPTLERFRDGGKEP